MVLLLFSGKTSFCFAAHKTIFSQSILPVKTIYLGEKGNIRSVEDGAVEGNFEMYAVQILDREQNDVSARLSSGEIVDMLRWHANRQSHAHHSSSNSFIEEIGGDIVEVVTVT